MPVLLASAAAVVFTVLVGGCVYLLAPFAAQIFDDRWRAVERQQARLRLTVAGKAVRR